MEKTLKVVNKALQNKLYINRDAENGIRYEGSSYISFNSFMSIEDLIKLMDLDIISFDNQFTRPSGVWDNTHKSDYIMSILLGLSITSLLDFSFKNGIYEILDGKQRLDTIYKFCNDEFILENISKEVFDNFGIANINGLKFSELPEEYQKRILESKIMSCNYVGLYPKDEKRTFTVRNRFEK